MEKQIEEMAKDLAENVAWDEDEIPTLDCLETAKRMYLKGYRKASDVTMEIEKVIGDKYECYVFDNINIEGVEQDAIIAFVDAMSNHFAELKKKYESEDGE